MKTLFIVSSRSLAVALNKIDLEYDAVLSTEIRHDRIILTLEGGTIEIYGVAGNREFSVTKEEIRWDWIKKTCNQIDEQPVLLTLTPNSANITTQY
jgi:hypothetical protein